MPKRPVVIHLPRPIAILDQDENGVPIPNQYLLTLRTLADVRNFLKRIPRENRAELASRKVEVALSEGPTDTAVALKLALSLNQVPFE